jgi:glycosyltransferase involved in cell wall biosynthesis
MTAQALSVVVPASNEARLLPGCLEALLRSEAPHLPVEAVVVSNGSRDGTAEVARGFAAAFAARGWGLLVLDLTHGGKPGALDAGDAAATGSLRAYLDADVTLSPPLLAGLARVLDRPEPAFASGRPRITGEGPVSRLYARTWARVPFMTSGVPGCGLFAVNAAGRARWGAWPPIIADDAFARLNFAPHERHLVPHDYGWPIAEGLAALVRVRRRQDRGVTELAELFPHLVANEGKAPLGAGGLTRLALRDPLGFMAYAGVAAAVRLGRHDGSWSRSR